MASKKKSVSIRMYNVGLGDSFLLRFPGEEREYKVLIDCGVHMSGPGPYRIREVVDRIIADVTDKDGTPRIDVVVATHRHADHIVGFESERWGEVEVGEVWMPWTEHPTDPAARKIRDKQSKKALAIRSALAAMRAPLALLEIVDNSLTNAKAMETLHGGFAHKTPVRYLPSAKRDEQTFVPKGLPGVTVHAMGPSRDPDVVRDMEPPKGGAFELRRAAAAGGNGGGNGTALFAKGFELTGNALRAQLEAFKLTAREMRELEKTADEDPFAVAVQLDKAVNGTSLMLMFEIGRAHLLFPGDAQWGTWQNALGDPEFKELLTKTNFLKVGHHGSHNATPREFVEQILAKDRFAAMVCTKETKKFKKIPLPSLLNALGSQSGDRLARSDQTTPVKGFKRNADVHTDTTVDI